MPWREIRADITLSELKDIMFKATEFYQNNQNIIMKDEQTAYIKAPKDR